MEDAAQDCVVCREPIRYYLLGPCDHRHTCHLCGLRMRALYETKTCPYCKLEAPKAIFTSDPSTPFNLIRLGTMHEHRKLQIFCETPELLREVEHLLQFNCPDCGTSCKRKDELNQHIKKEHPKLSLCHICVDNRKYFFHEHKLYTQSQLDRHRREGDPDDRSFRGHRQCPFCRKWVFADSEYYDHMEQNHHFCFICRHEGKFDQHYADYPALERHFEQAHFLCTDPLCRNQYMAFKTELDLKAHHTQVHLPGLKLSRAQERQLRQVDLGFSYGAPGPTGGRESRESREQRRGPSRQSQHQQNQQNQQNQAQNQQNQQQRAQQREQQREQRELKAEEERAAARAAEAQKLTWEEPIYVVASNNSSRVSSPTAASAAAAAAAMDAWDAPSASELPSTASSSKTVRPPPGFGAPPGLAPSASSSSASAPPPGLPTGPQRKENARPSVKTRAPAGFGQLSTTVAGPTRASRVSGWDDDEEEFEPLPPPTEKSSEASSDDLLQAEDSDLRLDRERQRQRASSLTSSTSASASPASPAAPAATPLMQRKNNELMDRVRQALDNREEFVSQFRSASRAFQQGTTDAATFYRFYVATLGPSASALFPLLVEALPDEAKRSELLRAEADWKAGRKPSSSSGSSSGGSSSASGQKKAKILVLRPTAGSAFVSKGKGAAAAPRAADPWETQKLQQSLLKRCTVCSAPVSVRDYDWHLASHIGGSSSGSRPVTPVTPVDESAFPALGGKQAAAPVGWVGRNGGGAAAPSADMFPALPTKGKAPRK